MFPTTPALALAAELAASYQIASLSGLLAVGGAAWEQQEISVAVLGRFKAGKSSFLNDLIGRGISSGPLPVGVIPLTTVVTEIRYGPCERADVHFKNGLVEEISVGEVGDYVSEQENPENSKQVERISIELPELRRFRGLKFVDTPGLDSAHAHNSRTSLDWLPNAGLALVAVGVDPPLSRWDIELVASLNQYTPKVAILLTKSDLLSEQDLAEVVEFVRSQLSRHLGRTLQVFPYSVKPGFARFRQALETALCDDMLERFAEQRVAILARKMDTLLRECGDYLALSLRSAELLASERQALKTLLVGEREAIDDVKSQIRLVVQHTAAGIRALVSTRLETNQNELERSLAADFENRFPQWTRSLAALLAAFEDWLAAGLRDRLAEVSLRACPEFQPPIDKVRKQACRMLQQFRDRLAERTERAFGLPLRTSETEIRVVEPATPDIRIGRVFDRNWELLSPVLPAAIVRPLVHRHFANKIPYTVFQNLSRLSAQWEESIDRVLWSIEKESCRRLEELIGTVERLVETSSNEQAPRLRADLARIAAARQSLADL